MIVSGASSSQRSIRSWWTNETIDPRCAAGAVPGFHGPAAIDTYEFRDEAERERYRTLTEELRCPKCQNQNIADSNAPIAMDLRRKSSACWRRAEQRPDRRLPVDRYGDFVRYNPPVNAKTLLLWYGPAGLLVLGFGVLAVIPVRRRRVEKAPASNTLSETERERLAKLLDKKTHDRFLDSRQRSAAGGAGLPAAPHPAWSSRPGRRRPYGAQRCALRGAPG